MTEQSNYADYKPCPYCGDRRPHFMPGGHCVAVLQAQVKREIEVEKYYQRKWLEASKEIEYLNGCLSTSIGFRKEEE